MMLCAAMVFQSLTGSAADDVHAVHTMTPLTIAATRRKGFGSMAAPFLNVKVVGNLLRLRNRRNTSATHERVCGLGPVTRGSKRHLEVQALNTLEVTNHFEEIAGLRVPRWTTV